MATVVADQVVLELVAKLDAYRNEVRRTQDDFRQQMQQMEHHASHAESAIKSSFEKVKRALEVFGIATSIREIGMAIGEAVSKVAEIKQFADAIGISTKAMQAMDRIAVKLGASTEELQRGLKRVATQAGEQGSFVQQLFAANKIDVSSNAETNIRNFMDLVKNAQSQTDRLVMVSKVIGGRASAAMVEAFSGGGEEIDKVFSDLTKSGESFSDAQIKDAQRVRNAYRVYMDDIALYWEKAIVKMLDWNEKWYNNVNAQRSRGVKLPGLDIARDPFDTGYNRAEGAGYATKLPDPGAEKVSKAIEQTTRETEREIQALRDEAAAFGMTTYEIVRQKKEREILGKLEDDHRKEGGVTTPEEIKKAGELADQYAKVTTALQESQKELQTLKGATDVVFNDMESQLDQFIENGKFSFKAFVESAIKDLAKLGLHNLMSQLEGGVSGPEQGTGVLGMLTRSLFGAPKVPGTGAAGGASRPSPLSQVPGVAGAVAPAIPSQSMGPANGPAWPVDPYTMKELPGLGHSIYTPGMTPGPRIGGGGGGGGWGGAPVYSGGSATPFTDLLSQVESGPRGYDSVLGGTRFTGGQNYDLSKMTIGEVKALQAKVLAQTSKLLPGDPNYAYHNSSAMGQYQIVGTTLRGEQDRLGLEDSTLFNKPIQDMMGNDLARQTRGDIGAIHNMWQGTRNIPDEKLGLAWNDQFGSSMNQITETAQKSAQSFSNTFPSALTSVLGAVTGQGGGAMAGLSSGIGLLGSAFSEHTGSFAGALAGGGDMMPGNRYLVGEHAPEIVTPKMPMTVHPLEGRAGSRIHVIPSKMFDVIVEEHASRASARMGEHMQRSFPAHQSSFQKLGTT